MIYRGRPTGVIIWGCWHASLIYGDWFFYSKRENSEYCCTVLYPIRA